MSAKDNPGQLYQNESTPHANLPVILALVALGALTVPHNANSQDFNVEVIAHVDEALGISNAYWLSISGNLVFVSSYSAGLTILDVSNPRSPAYVGSYTATNATNYGTVLVHENWAYLSASNPWPSGNPNSLLLLDVTNPAVPVLRRTYIDATILYAVSGNLGFFRDGGNVCIYDISNPVARTLVGTYGTGDTGFTDIALGTNMAYVSTGAAPGEFQIVDVSEPSSPRLVSIYKPYNPGEPTKRVDNSVVRGNLAYVGTEQGLVILDVSTPSHPQPLSISPTPERLNRVSLSGNLAFLVVRGVSSSVWSGLQVFDVSDPSSPTLVGSYQLPPPSGLEPEVIGDTAYVAGDESGLWILRYTGPVLAARPNWRLYK